MPENERNELLAVVTEAVDAALDRKLTPAIHNALDDYVIHVNSTVNESHPLPGWIGILATESRETRDVTAELRERAESKKARHRIIEDLSRSRAGRVVVALWGWMKKGAGWAFGLAVMGAAWKVIEPYFLKLFALLGL